MKLPIAGLSGFIGTIVREGLKLPQCCFLMVMLLVNMTAGAVPLQGERPPAGDGTVEISGELKTWHKVTLTLDGPFARERDADPNPFTDYQMTVTFIHESGEPRYIVPGYFAADGNAAETSAESGTKWRAHLCPDKPGTWNYEISFLAGKEAVYGEPSVPVSGCDALTGSFEIAPTDKAGRDFRARGRLEYVGKRYLRFAGTGDWFFKAGADAPETFLAYGDFDGTVTNKGIPLKAWVPHLRDWSPGDPTWQDGKGKGIIGAVNYMAGKGCNAISFLTYNRGGDGDNVWPFVERDAVLHYDCSKLDQWAIVIEHMQHLGIFAHFKLQETENDNEEGVSLDGGALGRERMLYYRELIARFGHNLALNWNLGEENTQTPDQQRTMARFFQEYDPYRHPVVIHTYPDQQDKVYEPLLGDGSLLTGVSLQNEWNETHRRTLKWITESAQAGRPWVVANDEQGSAEEGVPPDPGYDGFEGIGYDLNDIRKQTLWGNLMAGGAGVEYYFGYKLPQNDLLAEDYRSRDQSWDYCRIAIDFFNESTLPFVEMVNRDDLIGNPEHGRDKYCLAKPGAVYLVYLGYVSTTELDLSDVEGTYQLRWYNPREGGALEEGSVKTVQGGGVVSLGLSPSDPDQDWVAELVRTR